jgi:hypothetical protein
MGSIFVGKVLMSMYGQPAKAVADADLAPIKPGAWAAWARSNAGEQAAAPAVPARSTGYRAVDPRTPRLATGVHPR